MAPAAIMAGTLSPAGEPLHRLPPAEARPWTWVEPIRLTASSTPGQTFPKRGCSASTAPGTAAPTRKPPSAVSSIVVISAIFLMSTIRPGRTAPERICTRRSVPPARMRAALPAAANALIASSSVRGLKYRISVMVVLLSPCPLANVDCWLAFPRPAEGGAYTGKNDWNSLRGPVQAAGTYASSEVAPTTVGSPIVVPAVRRDDDGAALVPVMTLSCSDATTGCLFSEFAPNR